MSSPRAAAAIVAVALLGPGCRGFHEASIKQRLTQMRFFAHEVKRPLAEIDTFLTAPSMARKGPWCELCLISAITIEDGARQYCLSSHEEESCVIARPAPEGRTRFEAAPNSLQPSAQVIRELWNRIEPQGAGEAEVSTEEQIVALAAEEEDNFVPRWSFILGAKTGAIVSYDPPSFTFGGQAGFRYWGSLFVIPGATVEVESLVQAGRTIVTMGGQGRVELSLWNEENTRFANLPRLTFLMSAGPLVGFGRKAALGGRAVLGLHLLHLGRYLTPFFFELGFQAIEVDEQASTGLRIAVGLGF
jgi:hypothetical protein